MSLLRLLLLKEQALVEVPEPLSNVLRVFTPLMTEEELRQVLFESVPCAADFLFPREVPAH